MLGIIARFSQAPLRSKSNRFYSGKYRDTLQSRRVFFWYGYPLVDAGIGYMPAGRMMLYFATGVIMNAFTSLEIAGQFSYMPERLLEVQHQLPLLGDYVPLQVRNEIFTYATPTLKSLGDGAISLAIDRPFGFVRIPTPGPCGYLSQKVEEILLESGDLANGSWTATFETEQALSDQDESLFKHGIMTYGIYAGIELKRMDKARSAST